MYLDARARVKYLEDNTACCCHVMLEEEYFNILLLKTLSGPSKDMIGEDFCDEVCYWFGGKCGPGRECNDGEEPYPGMCFPAEWQWLPYCKDRISGEKTPANSNECPQAENYER
jgi:hypothetical protein